MQGELYRRGAVWYARLVVGGQEIRRSLRVRSEAEAKRELLTLKDRLFNQRYFWKEAVGKYLTEVAPGVIKPSVAVRYACSLKQLELLMPEYVDEVDARLISKIITERKRIGVTNATIKRDLTAVSRVLSACVGWGWVFDNPALNFDRSIIKERRDPIVLPTNEGVARVIKIAKEANPMAARLIRFYDLTGVRLKEGSHLVWDQVDLRSGRIVLTKTKTNRPRIVPLTDSRLRHVKLLLASTPKHGRSDFVFWHTQGLGDPYADFSAVFYRYARKAGVSFSVHDLRHKFAVDYLRQGGNIYRLQKILGHSSIKTTEIYLDYLSPDEQLEAQFGEG